MSFLFSTLQQKEMGLQHMNEDELRDRVEELEHLLSNGGDESDKDAEIEELRAAVNLYKVENRKLQGAPATKGGRRTSSKLSHNHNETAHLQVFGGFFFVVVGTYPRRTRSAFLTIFLGKITYGILCVLLTLYSLPCVRIYQRGYSFPSFKCILLYSHKSTTSSVRTTTSSSPSPTRRSSLPQPQPLLRGRILRYNIVFFSFFGLF